MTIEILKTILSWPTSLIIALIVLRKSLSSLIERLVRGDHGRAKLGPIEIELGQVAEQGREVVYGLSRLNRVMAESRLLELKITDGMFGGAMQETDRMRK